MVGLPVARERGSWYFRSSSFDGAKNVIIVTISYDHSAPRVTRCCDQLGAGLVARIGETGIGIHGTPRCVHRALSTKALLLFDSGRGLQHRHLELGNREIPNLILWDLLSSSRSRFTEDDKCCSQSCRSYNQDLGFHRSPPLVGVNSQSLSSLWLCQHTAPRIPIPWVAAPAKSLHSPLCAIR